MKGMHALGEEAYEHGETDHDDRVYSQDSCRICIGIDIGGDEQRQRNEFLPEDDPVSGEDEQEEHETWIRNDRKEVFPDLGESGCRGIVCALRFFEKKQHEKEHREYAQ